MSNSTPIRISNFKLNITAEDERFIIENIRKVLAGDRWTIGPMTESFEGAFRAFTGSSHAIAVTNGGTALVALLLGLEVPDDSIVLCPTLTAPPTPHAILASHMRVAFADSCPNDLGLDVNDVERKLDQYGDQVGAVITVHVGGWISPGIEDLQALCQQKGIPLIEDCAHSHGSFLNGNHAGSTAGLATYSFFMTKPLTAGEGGIITAEDGALADKLRIMRNYGKKHPGNHKLPGFNWRMSEFNAVVAWWASRNAVRIIEERRAIAARYDQMLTGGRGYTIVNVPGCNCSYYKYALLLDSKHNRDQIAQQMRCLGIQLAGGIYDTLCHEEPYFRSIPKRVLNACDSFPGAESVARRQLCLPLYPGLTYREQELVVQRLRNHLAD
jgi:dTDP-4-amino-4,6-dideoxygalactose transaminase